MGTQTISKPPQDVLRLIQGGNPEDVRIAALTLMAIVVEPHTPANALLLAWDGEISSTVETLFQRVSTYWKPAADSGVLDEVIGILLVRNYTIGNDGPLRVEPLNWHQMKDHLQGRNSRLPEDPWETLHQRIDKLSTTSDRPAQAIVSSYAAHNGRGRSCFACLMAAFREHKKDPKTPTIELMERLPDQLLYGLAQSLIGRKSLV